ncbi:hypothetical protein MWU60_05980 [Yoonia sp. F2084L]|uniref:hypothetical protein n=1 Tax=Yoonia sp. F2084L TaxID=2926419 RepID=UPI001FF30A5D|nr:hypothetical protein [Yoonia sp. F2084L]MCK0095110.1 hypothetical protein [Yoonia sp. F2084L]
MLSTIAPRWPRAFTTIGFGAIAVIVILHASIAALLPAIKLEAQRVLGEATLFIELVDETKTDVSDLVASMERPKKFLDDGVIALFLADISTWLDTASNAETFLLGAMVLFIVYVIGEICLACGRALWVSGDTNSHLTMVGEIAKIDNSIIGREYDYYTSSLTVLQGTAVLVVIFMFGLLFHLIETHEIKRFLGCIILGITLLLGIKWLANRNLAYLDAICLPFLKPDDETRNSNSSRPISDDSKAEVK